MDNTKVMVDPVTLRWRNEGDFVTVGFLPKKEIQQIKVKATTKFK